MNFFDQAIFDCADDLEDAGFSLHAVKMWPRACVIIQRDGMTCSFVVNLEQGEKYPQDKATQIVSRAIYTATSVNFLDEQID